MNRPGIESCWGGEYWRKPYYNYLNLHNSSLYLTTEKRNLMRHFKNGQNSDGNIKCLTEPFWKPKSN